jgi:hypothetical protein
VAGGFEGGIAVVILAIYLDRLTAALAASRPPHPWPPHPWPPHPASAAPS